MCVNKCSPCSNYNAIIINNYYTIHSYIHMMKSLGLSRLLPSAKLKKYTS